MFERGSDRKIERERDREMKKRELYSLVYFPNEAKVRSRNCDWVS